jgi:hypothetical protein
VVILAGCHPRPIEDLVLADVAVRAAQKVKAESLAPDLFRKAENHYLRAKKDFSDGYYDSCRKNANDARLLAEQAEYHSLLKQTQLKDKSVGDDATPPPPAEGAAPPTPEP